MSSSMRWGRHAWMTLHTFAHTYPEVADPDRRREMREFLVLFAKNIPCPKCRLHFEEFLRDRLDDASLEGRRGLVEFMNDAHNSVNERLGRHVWTLHQHYAIYDSDFALPPSIVTLLLAVVLVLILRLR
jgi:hypothetical protein